MSHAPSGGDTPEIPGYRLVRRLGSGGMGSVWEALDDAGDRVALKILHPALAVDPVARRRLEREAAVLACVRGPGVARVLDVEAGTGGGEHPAFVVTELVDGPTLAEEVAAGGAYDVERDLQDYADLAHGLVEALRSVHAAGVIHRDLKPSNVMLGPDGPVLIDFGISQLAGDARLTVTGQVTGTPGFIAPEVIDGGAPDEAGDWYACAGLLLFAVTGTPPFGNGPWHLVLQRASHGRVELGALPWRAPALARAFAEALAPEPDQRLPVDGLVAVIDECAAGGDGWSALAAWSGDAATCGGLATAWPQAADDAATALLDDSPEVGQWDGEGEWVRGAPTSATAVLPAPHQEEWPDEVGRAEQARVAQAPGPSSLDAAAEVPAMTEPADLAPQPTAAWAEPVVAAPAGGDWLDEVASGSEPWRQPDPSPMPATSVRHRLLGLTLVLAVVCLAAVSPLAAGSGTIAAAAVCGLVGRRDRALAQRWARRGGPSADDGRWLGLRTPFIAARTAVSVALAGVVAGVLSSLLLVWGLSDAGPLPAVWTALGTRGVPVGIIGPVVAAGVYVLVLWYGPGAGAARHGAAVLAYRHCRVWWRRAVLGAGALLVAGASVLAGWHAGGPELNVLAGAHWLWWIWAVLGLDLPAWLAPLA